MPVWTPLRRLSHPAAHEAEGLRELTWGERYPVDPVRIAHRLGVQVVDALLDEKLLGALVKEVGRDPVIMLPATDSVARKRLTCAFELGRFASPKDDYDEYFHVDRRGRWIPGLDPSVDYAQEFAAALLMPRRVCKSLRREGYGDVELAAYFDVSREGVAQFAAQGLLP